MMINSVVIEENKHKQIVGHIADDIYLLPRWEIIKSFAVREKKFFFFNKFINVNLLIKFSSKNMLEKYAIRTLDGKNLACMDLMVYKDNVYIVNLEISSNDVSGEAVEKLLQTSVEKSMYNTTEQEVIINVSSDFEHRGKIKKILLNNGFCENEKQSEYEIKMFGQEYKFSAKTNDCWKT